MNILDIVLLILGFGLFVYGFIKGFVSFLTKVLAVVGTVVFGVFFGDVLAGIFANEFGLSVFVGKLIAFVLIFLAVVILLKIFSVYIRKGLDFLDLGIYDKILGALFIVLLFLGIVALLSVGFNIFFDYNLLQNPAVASSRILRFLLELVQNFYPGVV